MPSTVPVPQYFMKKVPSTGTAVLLFCTVPTTARNPNSKFDIVDIASGLSGKLIRSYGYTKKLNFLAF